MINTIFFYGTLSGLIIIATMTAMIASGSGDHGGTSLFVGYLIMIIALSVIFFGIKQYRDRELGGVIKFIPALMMGVGIAAVAGVIYVLIWEVYLVATNYSFMDAYAAAMIEAERAKGVTGPALDAKVQEFEAFKIQYKDPLVRLPITFLEIFPVGLLIAVISAAILRNPRALPARA